MIGIKNYRSGFVALAAASMLFGAGCDKVKECAEGLDLTCDSEALASGNASITGFGAVDGFFSAVLSFEGAADSVAGGINAELEGIRDDFGLDASGEVGALLAAKLDTYIEGDLRIKAEPARCEVDAQASFEASAKCQAEVGCEAMVDPGKAQFQCEGRCDAEVAVDADCGVDASLECEVTAPSFECNGQCQGTCVVDANVDAGCSGSCSGSCSGTCNGTCDGMTGSGIDCSGTCDGTCTGTCDAECTIDAQVAVDCQGSCTGSCSYTAGDAGCDAMAKAYCEGSVDASVTCEGKCDGDFEPPSAMVQCEASASCNASAKAEASVNVECTPPSVEIDYTLKAGLSAELEAEFKAGISKLRTRLPKLLAAIKKGDLVVAAGGDLIAAAGTAVDGIVDAAAKGDIQADVAFKLATCAPAQFKEAGNIVKSSSDDLKAQVEDAVAFRSAVNL